MNASCKLCFTSFSLCLAIVLNCSAARAADVLKCSADSPTEIACVQCCGDAVQSMHWKCAFFPWWWQPSCSSLVDSIQDDCMKNCEVWWWDGNEMSGSTNSASPTPDTGSTGALDDSGAVGSTSPTL